MPEPHDRMERTAHLVASRSPYTVAQLREPGRDTPRVYWRQAAIYVQRCHAGASYPQLGRWWGLHHTTALHAVEKVARGDVPAAVRAVVTELDGYVATLVEVGAL